RWVSSRTTSSKSCRRCSPDCRRRRVPRRRARGATVPARELATASPEETEALGAALGRAAQGGEIVGLVGELGAGKTCFVRGLARGLGADAEAVHSPSFTIATEYRSGRLPLVHVDLYRLDAPWTDAPFLRDVLFGPGVVAVEWFDRLTDVDDVLRVRL